jgi:hypothetical protein
MKWLGIGQIMELLNEALKFNVPQNYVIFGLNKYIIYFFLMVSDRAS